MDIFDEVEKKFSEQNYATNSLLSLSRVKELASDVPIWVDLEHKSLNLIFGDNRGFPTGKIIELYGGESHGKTALAYYLIGKFQKAGGEGILSDIEASFHPEWAAKLGVDIEKLLFVELGTKEVKKAKSITCEMEGLEDLLSKFSTLVDILKVEHPDIPVLIVWDSVASTLTRKELNGDYGDDGIALMARALSSSLKRLHHVVKGSNVSVLCLNQVRTKIATGFGMTMDTTPGGRALKFYSSIRVKVARTQSPRSGFISCEAKNVKSKVAPQGAVCKFKITKEGIEI